MAAWVLDAGLARGEEVGVLGLHLLAHGDGVLRGCGGVVVGGGGPGVRVVGFDLVGHGRGCGLAVCTRVTCG